MHVHIPLTDVILSGSYWGMMVSLGHDWQKGPGCYFMGFSHCEGSSHRVPFLVLSVMEAWPSTGKTAVVGAQLWSCHEASVVRKPEAKSAIANWRVCSLWVIDLLMFDVQRKERNIELRVCLDVTVPSHTNNCFPWIPSVSKREESYFGSRNGRKTERSFVCQTDSKYSLW